MQVFSGFTLPPLLHTIFLLGGTVTIVALLYVTQPPITQRTVLSFVPWVVSGSALHAFYQLGEVYDVQIYPGWAEPLFAAPAVYLTTFLAMGTIWVAANVVGTSRSDRDPNVQYLSGMGIGIALPLLGLVIWQGLDPAVGPIRPFVPVLTAIVTGVVTFVIYVLLGAWRTYVIAEARYVGALLLFSHLLDGISTAVAYDVYGTPEGTLLPRRIMQFAADLPTAKYIGAGWLFVVVKLVVAIIIIVAFADYVREKPNRGNLFFAAVSVVGLGPGVYNLMLAFLGV